jgi:hypothetical protein
MTPVTIALAGAWMLLVPAPPGTQMAAHIEMGFPSKVACEARLKDFAGRVGATCQGPNASDSSATNQSVAPLTGTKPAQR